jgi:hypothetical protein
MDLNKDRLRTAYNEVVAKIDANVTGLLSGTLYKADAEELVFETAYAALLDSEAVASDTASPPTQPRKHVVSAPADIQAIYHDHNRRDFEARPNRSTYGSHP